MSQQQDGTAAGHNGNDKGESPMNSERESSTQKPPVYADPAWTDDFINRLYSLAGTPTQIQQVIPFQDIVKLITEVTRPIMDDGSLAEVEAPVKVSETHGED